MKILIILGHPDPDSLNHGMAHAVKEDLLEAVHETAFGDPLEAIWRRCIFDLCGVKNFHRRMFAMVVTSTMEQRRFWIEEAKVLCRTAFQLGANNNSLHSDGSSSALPSRR